MSPNYNGPQRQQAHYQVMHNDSIVGMGPWVRELAAGDSILFLWAPHFIVLEGTATAVARAWGFEPKQEVVWVKTAKNGKPRLGAGHYFRLCTEPFLVCTRGRAAQLVERHDLPNVFFAPRQAHSAKPDESYEMMEQLVRGPYLELFARRQYSPEWVVWGNQL